MAQFIYQGLQTCVLRGTIRVYFQLARDRATSDMTVGASVCRAFGEGVAWVFMGTTLGSAGRHVFISRAIGALATALHPARERLRKTFYMVPIDEVQHALVGSRSSVQAGVMLGLR